MSEANPGLVGHIELRGAVTAALRELILSGEVTSDDRLVETELAARFGTSRGPVRDAFKDLEKSGLVITIPRRGTFVRSLTTDDIDEIYSLRMALEGLAIDRFALDDAAELTDALSQLAKAHKKKNRRAIAEADMHFHRVIVNGASHDRLSNAWERLADQTVLLMGVLSDYRPDIQSATGDHKAIADALTAGRTKAAGTAMTKHLTIARESMTQR